LAAIAVISRMAPVANPASRFADAASLLMMSSAGRRCGAHAMIVSHRAGSFLHPNLGRAIRTQGS
jgi:hypothetical protein